MSITAAILICLAPVAYDGDTVRCGTSPTSVRLFGLKAVELNEVGGPEAKAAMARETPGGWICEPKGTSYSRIVAICRNFKGEDIGANLLRAGFVVEDCAYSRNHYGSCTP